MLIKVLAAEGSLSSASNVDKAKSALKILTNEQIEFIKQRLDTGGKR